MVCLKQTGQGAHNIGKCYLRSRVKTAIIIIIIITIIIIGFYTERKIVADGTTWDIILGSQLVGAEDLLQAQGA